MKGTVMEKQTENEERSNELLDAIKKVKEIFDEAGERGDQKGSLLIIAVDAKDHHEGNLITVAGGAPGTLKDGLEKVLQKEDPLSLVILSSVLSYLQKRRQAKEADKDIENTEKLLKSCRRKHRNDC